MIPPINANGRPLATVPRRDRHCGLARATTRAALALVAAFAACVGGAAARAQSADMRVAPSPGFEALQLNVSEFEAYWQRAWRASEEYRYSRLSEDDFQRRLVYVNCYYEFFADRAVADRIGWSLKYPPQQQYQSVRSSRPAKLLCPTWPLTERNIDAENASSWRDAALIPSLRASVEARRRALIDRLQLATAKDPNDGWIVGQLVRFALDSRSNDSAVTYAKGCGAARWWCAALLGHAYAKTGRSLEADSAFAEMRREMSVDQRCTWEDLTPLLSAADQAVYKAQTCAERTALLDGFWWLADPMLSVPGNERRVEQDSRRTDVALRYPQDERNVFDVERGGDAVSQLIVRYGWPSYAAWFGVGHDRNTSYQGLEVNHSAVPSEPYTSFEYSRDRVSTLPSLAVAAAPLMVKLGQLPLQVDDSMGAPSPTWWPQEHFRPQRRMVALGDAQIAFFRRQNNAEVALSAALTHRSLKDVATNYNVLMLSSPNSHRVDSLDVRAASANSVVVLRSSLDTGATLIAVEAFASSPERPDVRLRVGVRPPMPLSALPHDEIALSDLAVLSETDPTLLQTPTADLLLRMRPSLRFSTGDRRAALFWEEYGVEPEDSARYVLRVVPMDEAGLLRRIGSLTGILADASRGLELSWAASASRDAASQLAGPVPARLRAIGLDLRALRAGRYLIGLDLVLPSGTRAHSETSIELIK